MTNETPAQDLRSALEPFQREERYIVIKRKHLTDGHEAFIRGYLDQIGAPSVECVVVERDWPECEAVWRMIEARHASALTQPAENAKGGEVACAGCEGSPAPENNPCEVCGKLAHPPCGEEVANEFWRRKYGRDWVAPPPAAEPIDDASLKSMVGELGNQIHNLGCERQGDEALAGRLEKLRSEAWKIARLAPATAPAAEPVGLREDYCEKCDDSGYVRENGRQEYCDCACGHDAMDQADGKGMHAVATPARTDDAGDAIALEAYRAAVRWIAADSWDGCSECIRILQMARSLDDMDWTPDQHARALKRLYDRSGQAALSPAPDRGEVDASRLIHVDYIARARIIAKKAWEAIRPVGGKFWNELPDDVQTLAICAARDGYSNGRDNAAALKPADATPPALDEGDAK